MKKYLAGFLTALLLVGTIAFMRSQSAGILISGGFGGEPKLKAVQPDQTANWIEFDNFAVPSTGIIPVAYGGTGVASLAALQAAVSNAPTSGITAIANGGTGTNTAGKALILLGAMPASASLTNLALGIGTGLTNLNASALTGSMTASVSGDGSGFTNLNGSTLMVTNWPIYPHIGISGAVTWTTNQ